MGRVLDDGRVGEHSADCIRRTLETSVKEKEKPEEPTWEECHSLEEWVTQMLKQGYVAIVKNMMNVMPDASKEKYRAIWARVNAEKQK